MHELLRAIGFSSVRTKKQLKALTDWVLENPDHVDISLMTEEDALAVASREVNGHAGITVVGTVDESGAIVPEYYFPYAASSQASSDAPISFERETEHTGFIGMCEDPRVGMSLIFHVSNVGHIWKANLATPFDLEFSHVALTALCLDGTVLLPASSKVLVPTEKAPTAMNMFQPEEAEPSDIAAEAFRELKHIHDVTDRLRKTDVFTVVDNFFMPYGMATYHYYFLGRILASQRLENRLTKEHFYRISMETNGMPFLAVIHEDDLQGVPEPGYRLKCHGWLSGELAERPDIF